MVMERLFGIFATDGGGGTRFGGGWFGDGKPLEEADIDGRTEGVWISPATRRADIDVNSDSKFIMTTRQPT
jgi:hypothetical protein